MAGPSPLVDELEQFIDPTDENKFHAEKAHDWADLYRDSEIGRRLEWNDTVAGRQFRLGQIRTLVRIYLVEPVTRHRETVSLRIDRPLGGGYRQLADVLNNRQLRAHAVADALSEHKRLCERHSHLDELKELHDFIIGWTPPPPPRSSRRGRRWDGCGRFGMVWLGKAGRGRVWQARDGMAR